MDTKQNIGLQSSSGLEYYHHPMIKQNKNKNKKKNFELFVCTQKLRYEFVCVCVFFQFQTDKIVLLGFLFYLRPVPAVKCVSQPGTFSGQSQTVLTKQENLTSK
jgi:hypothetical protein